MNAAKQAVWLFIALLTLACSSLYFASSKPVNRLNDSILSNTPDTVISDLVVKRFDEAGKLVNYMQTPDLQHVPANNTHLIKLPHLILTQNDDPPWEIRAKQARSINSGEQITFIKDVVIHQGKNKKGQESTIKTEIMDYFSKTKVASTNAPVRFEQPGSVVLSKGMKAYFEDKRVELSHARATFEPKHA